MLRVPLLSVLPRDNEDALDERLKKLEKEKKKLMNKTILEKSGEVDNDGDTWLKIPKEGDDDIEMIRPATKCTQRKSMKLSISAVI